jgi:hypothetical protein
MLRFYMCAGLPRTRIVPSREFFADTLDGAFALARLEWPDATWIGVA